MNLLPQNTSELFITRMRWLVIFGSPLLFYLSGLPTGLFFWIMVIGTAVINIYVHAFLLDKPIRPGSLHILSVLDTVFVSTLLFLRGEHQTDLHQLYYFLILILGIRYGIKNYFGLVLVIGLIYTAVSVIGTAFYETTLDTVQLATQLIYFLAFGILTSFILEREYRQRLEKEELVAEIQEAYRQLCIYSAKVEEMAIKDPLTGLYNYRFFIERLNAEIEWAQKNGKPMSVILIDIDHFKVFNDTYGHPAGDTALRTAADAFSKNIRDRDVLARYGGEEFLIMIPDTDLHAAYNCAERIRKAIETTNIIVEQVATPLRITISAGVAALSPNAGNASQLLENADKALYTAKDGGRNIVKIFRDTDEKQG